MLYCFTFQIVEEKLLISSTYSLKSKENICVSQAENVSDLIIISELPLLKCTKSCAILLTSPKLKKDSRWMMEYA